MLSSPLNAVKAVFLLIFNVLMFLACETTKRLVVTFGFNTLVSAYFGY